MLLEHKYKVAYSRAGGRHYSGSSREDLVRPAKDCGRSWSSHRGTAETNLTRNQPQKKKYKKKDYMKTKKQASQKKKKMGQL